MADFDGLGELLKVVRVDGLGGEFTGGFDAVVIAFEIDGAGGVVIGTGVEERHFSGEELSVAFKGKLGVGAALPNTESGFGDDGGILPADAEVEFAVDAAFSVEERPGAAAAQTGTFFVLPVLQ